MFIFLIAVTVKQRNSIILCEQLTAAQTCDVNIIQVNQKLHGITSLSQFLTKYRLIHLGHDPYQMRYHPLKGFLGLSIQ